MKDHTRQKAFDKWCEGIDKNTDTDRKTNDLLEEIAGRKYNIYEQDDDPIYTIIGNLTASERRRFIKGVNEILRRY